MGRPPVRPAFLGEPAPELLAVLPLATTALFAPGSRQVMALAAIMLLGVPHGALAGEIARTLLRPRCGRLRFAVFSLPYLALSALMLAVFAALPPITAFPIYFVGIDALRHVAALVADPQRALCAAGRADVPRRSPR